MHTLTYKGEVKNNKIILPKERFKKEVCRAFEGKEIEVIVKKKKRRRSLDQNAYYWSAVIPGIVQGLIDLGHELMYGNEAHHYGIHEFLKNKFLDNGKDLADTNGVMIRIPPSTRMLTKLEFMHYLELVIKWAAEDLNTVIPLPNKENV